MRAITRRPSARMVDAELTHIERCVIDLVAAERQHREYRAALAGLGVELVDLPALDAYPDCAFVEDTCLAFPELFVLTRPGAASRLGEVDLLAPALPADRPVMRLPEPVRLDGGDVLVLGRDVFVGLSSRTTRAAIEALAAMLRPFGYAVCPVDVQRSLHLKTAVTALPDQRLLVNSRWVDVGQLDGSATLEAADDESFGANVLSVGTTVFGQAAMPRTRERLAAEGYDVTALDIAEFAKAEAGLTCMSILVPDPSV